MSYARIDWIFLALIGGAALNWNEVRAIFRTIAAAAVVNLAATRLFQNAASGRVTLEASGTIGNPNDLAAQLLLVLPFLMFFMLGRGRSIILRIAVPVLLLYGLWAILGTASRGGLVGLAAVFLYVLFNVSLPKKLAMVVACVVLVLAAMTILPAATRNRLGSMFGGKHAEAADSEESRQYLLVKSLQFTIQHPVFGVGPDQFSSYEGKSSRARGLHGNWHATHNAYTQVSSECGVPAAIFFVGGLGSAMLLVLRTRRRAIREGYREIATSCFCYLAGMVGYLVALLFLSQAYSFKLPAMVGLAVTLSFTAMRTMESDRAAQAALSLGPTPPNPVRH